MLYELGHELDCQMAIPKRNTKQKFSDFISVTCSATIITSLINGLLLVTLQHLVWEKVLLYNFREFYFNKYAVTSL